MFETHKLLCFGCFDAGQKVNGCFPLTKIIFLLACIEHRNIYNRLVITCIVKTVTEIDCLCLTSEKKGLCLQFFSVACVTTNRSIQRVERLA